ncbi:1712_t:CDS:2 [Gigaspora rosea]|nr:1712_t:CDS:2 [Gigaspora rosea]
MWLFSVFAISWSIKDCVNPDFTNREFDNAVADEIGSIPFTCPSDYPYKVAAIRTACIIRSANIICMWSFILLAVLWITVDLYWDEDEGDDEEAIKNIQEELSRDNKA